MRSAVLRACCLVWLLGSVAGVTRRHDVSETDQFAQRLINAKGMVAGARVTVTYTLTAPDEQRVAYLLLLGRKQSTQWYDKMVSRHHPEDDSPWLVCGSPSYKRHEIVMPRGNRTQGNVTFVIDATDQYTMQLASCDDGVLQGRVTASFVNPDLDGKLTQYLAAEALMRPMLFNGLFVVYLFLTSLWAFECWRLSEHTQSIHSVVLLSLVWRCLEVFAQARYLVKLNAEGEVDWLLWAFREFAKSVSTAHFLAVLLLVSVGWSLLRATLEARETVIIAGVIAVYIGIAIGRIAEHDTDDEQALVMCEYVLRSLVLLSIIVALNFNITHLRQTITDMPNPIGGELAHRYSKLHQLQLFRWAFLGYLLLPTILLILEVAVLTWEYDWINDYLSELTFLLIHVHVGCAIAPSNSDLLTQAFVR